MMYWRNIWRNPQRTLVILTAVFIGVAGMIFMAAMMKGMVFSMVDNSIKNLTGHFLVRADDFVSDPSVENRLHDADKLINDIRGVLPAGAKSVQRIRLDGVVNTARDSYGVTAVGTNLADESGLSFIGDADVDGKLPVEASVLIGRALSEKSGLVAGKRLVLNMQDADGELVSRSFIISGIFKAGQKQQEENFIFIPLTALQKMLKSPDSATEISIGLPAGGVTADVIQKILPKGVSVMSWREVIPAMGAYMDVFDNFMFIWYLIVFIAMGFGIVNTVLMAVYERMREFGLMRALGVKTSGIFATVVAETSIIILLGLAAGNFAAYLLIGYFAKNGIDLSAFASGVDMFAVSRVVYPVFTFGDYMDANLTVFLLGVIVSLYPAYKACGFTPVQTMREV